MSFISLMTVSVGVILMLVKQPEEFSKAGAFFYYTVIFGLLIISSAMVLIGFYLLKLRESLRLSIICLVLGILIALVYAGGNMYRYQVFNGFLKDKEQKVDEISSEMDRGMKVEDICKYSLPLAKIEFYLKGEISTYINCNGETLSFSPTSSDMKQRGQIVLIQSRSDRAASTAIAALAAMAMSIGIGFIFMKVEHRR